MISEGKERETKRHEGGEGVEKWRETGGRMTDRWMDARRRGVREIYKGVGQRFFSVSLQATHNRRSEKEERRETTIRKYKILPLYSR